MSQSNKLLRPSADTNSDEQERRVGVELEFSGLGYKTLVPRVRDILGGELGRQDYYESVIETEDGDYLVELDSAPVKALKEENERDLPEPLAQIRNGAMDLIEAVAERLVPLEIVCPPLPLSKLDRVQTLCRRLQEAGALGSRHSVYFAFGCQLNPELPDTEPRTILNYMQAFAGLYPWLRERQQLDFSRKLTTYINPWPREYVELITGVDYNPSLDQLVIDYIEYNPTRNRALDLMPLWAELKPDILWQCVDDPRIKARPTLHYRLPDCDIDNPDWGFENVWNDWMVVEALAGNEALLADFLEAFRKRQKWSLENLATAWVKECDQWAQRALSQ
jgi:hypothetical protein